MQISWITVYLAIVEWATELPAVSWPWVTPFPIVMAEVLLILAVKKYFLQKIARSL